jgi:osmotically-inducible protein OsmY
MHCFSVFFQSSLKGEVKGAGEKLRAQELPASLTGVKEVANELKIKEDSGIAYACKSF